MPIPLVLEEGITSGRGPLCFTSMIILYGIANAADHIFLEPDPEPDVIGAILQVRIAGRQHDMVPVPYRCLLPIVGCVRRLAHGMETGDGMMTGRIPVSLAQTVQDIGVAFFDERRLSLFFPIAGFDRDAARRLIATASDEKGLMEFHDDEFE